MMRCSFFPVVDEFFLFFFSQKIDSHAMTNKGWMGEPGLARFQFENGLEKFGHVVTNICSPFY